jgi:hypothetical protein
MPVENAMLHVGFDLIGNMCLWAAVDSDAPVRDVEIIIAGTGHPLPHVGSYLGTIVIAAYVWHIFTGPGDAGGEQKNFHHSTKDNGNAR